MVIPSSLFHNSERHFQVPLAQKGCAGSSDEGSGGAGKLRSSCDPCWQEVIDNEVWEAERFLSATNDTLWLNQ